MRVVIVDDEPLARRGMRQLLRSHKDVEIVGEARNGLEAIRLTRTVSPHLMFLDIQMPEMDGFEVLRQLGEERMPAVIFVTAFDAFAVRAFEAHALDYLVKPVHEVRFHRALARARDRLHSEEAIALSLRLSQLLASHGLPNAAPSGEPARRLIIPTSEADQILDVGEIDWIEADDYYSAVHARGRRYLLRESLDSLEQRLDQTRFVRIHRSAIVSLAKVREIRSNRDTAAVVLMDGTRVPLSRRRREAVAEAVRRFAG